MGYLLSYTVKIINESDYFCQRHPTRLLPAFEQADLRAFLVADRVIRVVTTRVTRRAVVDGLRLVRVLLVAGVVVLPERVLTIMSLVKIT